MDKETLNSLVSSAIWRAEQTDVSTNGNALEAWAEVSRLEEELATLYPATTAEGKIARRGAVRAALKAGDSPRAERLARTFRSEPGAPASLVRSLSELVPGSSSPQLVSSA